MNVVPLRQPVQEPDRIMTRVELADRYRVSVRTVDRWVVAGCPSERWGLRVRRFRVQQVEAWLSRRAA